MHALAEKMAALINRNELKMLHFWLVIKMINVSTILHLVVTLHSLYNISHPTFAVL